MGIEPQGNVGKLSKNALSQEKVGELGETYLKSEKRQGI